jgi:hypothetical protein
LSASTPKIGLACCHFHRIRCIRCSEWLTHLHFSSLHWVSANYRD